jgi:hypothetical protein
MFLRTRVLKHAGTTSHVVRSTSVLYDMIWLDWERVITWFCFLVHPTLLTVLYRLCDEGDDDDFFWG